MDEIDPTSPEDGPQDPDPTPLEEIVPPGLDPGAAALAMSAARTNPGLAEEAAAYFRRQAKLVEIQTEHLHEQRAVQLAHLKLRRRTEWLRGATQICILAAGLVAVCFALMMVRNAANSHTVIVEAFETPPALAASGLSGKVVASLVLDHLVKLQSATHVDAGKLPLTDAWTHEIKIDLPRTGISIAEVDRFLKAHLGHETRIGGDLIQMSSGVKLTIRANVISPRSFDGPMNNLDEIAGRAAEYIYGQSQPALYAGFLESAGRSAEAVAFSTDAFRVTSGKTRAALLVNWASALSDVGGAVPDVLGLYEEALKTDPETWTAYSNMIVTLQDDAQEEAAMKTCQRLSIAAGGRPGNAPDVMYNSCDAMMEDLRAERDGARANGDRYDGFGTSVHDTVTLTVADAEAGMHNPAEARLWLQTISKSRMADPVTAAGLHLARALVAAELGDHATALAEFDDYESALSNPVLSQADAGSSCTGAVYEEDAGHPDKADAVIKRGGAFVDCLRFHADLLDRRGHWAAAQLGYAQAVKLAPDLPAAYYSWGLALARHGDAEGAQQKLSLANQYGPHWADPLRSWGDILARQGHKAAALAKYDAALKYAPAWADLLRARQALASSRS
jgi:tetratricopeptide (TPR) repeat protein